MADFQEEVYIIEKQEITDDEQESYDSPGDPIEEDPELNADLDLESDDEEDLNDFNALKTKMDEKLAKKQKDAGVSAASHMTMKDLGPKSVERPVVIDDFIRNFLTKGKMNKTMNIFQ